MLGGYILNIVQRGESWTQIKDTFIIDRLQEFIHDANRTERLNRF
jgi:hypothetical protein